MTTPVLVHIGLPVYNGERCIRQTIDSLLAQQDVALELIISDNGSTDGTQGICRAYAAKDPRVKYHRYNENRGAIWNFNNAFELCSAEYFMWASHDDFWDPSYVKTCLNAFKESVDVVLAGCASVCVDDVTSAVILVDPGLTTVGLTPAERFKRYKLIVRRPENMNSLFYGVYRRSALAKVMPLMKVMASDHILMAHLALLGEFVTVQEKLMTKRGGGDSLSIAKVARAIPITNPFLLKFPHLVRETVLQNIVFSCETLQFFDKCGLSLWSWLDFFRCSLRNRTAKHCKR